MRITLICFALFTLASCGFEPVHGTKTQSRIRAEGGLDLAAVAITTDRSRLGQLLKAEIADRIHPTLSNRPKRFRLSITFEESLSSRFINPDGTASRGDFVYTSNYTLTDLKYNRTIDSGTLTRTSSFNIADTADYATFVTQEDARKRGITELARGYALRLINIKVSDKKP